MAFLPGTTTALVELALVLAQRGDRILLPDPGYPDYNSAVALAGAERVALPLGEDGRPDWGARRGSGSLPSISTTRRTRRRRGAGRRLRRGGRLRARDGRRDRPRLRLRRPRLRRPPPRELPRRARARATSASRCSRSRRATAWPAGGSASSSATPRSSARLNLVQEHVRSGVFVPLQRAAVAALTGPQETVEERRALYERAARPRPRRDSRARAAKARSSSGSRCRRASPSSACSTTTASRSRRARASASAAAATPGISLATPTRRSTKGSRRLRRAFAAE